MSTMDSSGDKVRRDGNEVIIGENRFIIVDEWVHTAEIKLANIMAMASEHPGVQPSDGEDLEDTEMLTLWIPAKDEEMLWEYFGVHSWRPMVHEGQGGFAVEYPIGWFSE